MDGARTLLVLYDSDNNFHNFLPRSAVQDISIFISYQQSIFRITYNKMLSSYSFSKQLYQKSVKRKNLVFSQ